MKRRKDITDYLLDDELAGLVRRGDDRALEDYVVRRPEDETMIREAVLLMNRLQIDRRQVSWFQAEKDHGRLMARLDRRRPNRAVLWVTRIVVAASIVLFIAVFPFDYFFGSRVPQPDAQLFSMLSAAEISESEVQLVSGELKTNIGDNLTIEQTESGQLLVGTGEVIEADRAEAEFVQLIVPYGRRSSIRFSDGTTAWLNSGSKLVYPKVFSRGKREIYLDGEVYLEVARDERRPFYVHTQGMTVNVLGTTFNVCALEEENVRSVVLVEGLVEVISGNAKHHLAPSQGLFVEQGRISVRDVDPYPYISWREGIIQLQGESLDHIVRRLARYYNLTIEADYDLTRERYRGKLNLNESVEEVMDNLALSSPFTYVREDNRIRMRHRP